MAKPKLRNLLFVAIHNVDDEAFLMASELPEDAIEDNGPTIVGTYKLVGKRKLVLGMQEVPMRNTGK